MSFLLKLYLLYHFGAPINIIHLREKITPDFSFELKKYIFRARSKSSSFKNFDFISFTLWFFSTQHTFVCMLGHENYFNK